MGQKLLFASVVAAIATGGFVASGQDSDEIPLLPDPDSFSNQKVNANPESPDDAPAETPPKEQSKQSPAPSADRHSVSRPGVRKSSVPANPQGSVIAPGTVSSDASVTGGQPQSHVITADGLEIEAAPIEGKILQTKQDVRSLESLDVQINAGAQTNARARMTSKRVFGSASAKASINLLSAARRKKAAKASASIVLGIESKSRATTDAGDLLTKSAAGIGIARQKRTPIVTDTRVRGTGVGKQVASGSYWIPARLDLDTLMSKIDSRLIEDMIVVKGPYSALYGPGYNFTDIGLKHAPRSADGYQAFGSSMLEYKTNGEQWYAREDVWGGAENWGFRGGYGHRTGNDYKTGGSRSEMPSSYNSGITNFAFGYDLAENQHVEFNYLRLDQKNIEFPGMVFDMNYLNTNAWGLEYVIEGEDSFDTLTVDSWYNLTRFQGDTFGSGKNRQIPTLRLNLFPFDGSGDPNTVGANLGNPGIGTGNAITDVWALSTGFSAITNWGTDEDEPKLSIGVDLRYVAQELNDVEILRPQESNNFPIPPSYAANPGLLAEYEVPIDHDWRVRTGGRIDFVMTNAQNRVNGVGETTGDAMTGFTGTPVLITDRLMTSSLNRNFTLWSTFVDLEHDLDENVTVSVSYGLSQRAPNLTELYAAGPFVNLLQSGLTTLTGDPELEKERMQQIDVSLDANYENVRGRLTGFHAWIEDYITFDGGLLAEAEIGQRNNRILFTNTDRATLAGFEASTEVDATDRVTAFSLMSYTEGRDHTRREPSRIRGTGNRSDSTTESEPLPNVPPFEARFGLRVHSIEDEQPWAIELSARMVDNQDRFASSLLERSTPGFTTYDIRGFFKLADNWTFTTGIENFTDKYYREHLDYRAGLGVFQPGINAYFGTEVTY